MASSLKDAIERVVSLDCEVFSFVKWLDIVPGLNRGGTLSWQLGVNRECRMYWQKVKLVKGNERKPRFPGGKCLLRL